MTLESTQPLSEVSNRNISWGKGGWCVGLTTLLPSCAESLEILEPESPGLSRTVMGKLSYYILGGLEI